MTLTSNRKMRCVDIFNRIDNDIPLRNYVWDILEDLEKRGVEFRPGIPYTESQVLQTRNRRSFHLDIAEAFERLYGAPVPAVKPKASASPGKKVLAARS